MAVNWFVDEGLLELDAEWKRLHPNAVVYHIGDASHASRDSEHNPEPAGSEPGATYGEVDASDFMEGNGVTDADLDELFEGLVKSRDPRILYVIRNRTIVSSVVQPWVRRTYAGSDPHTNHVHLSVNDRYAKNAADWKWEPAVEQSWKMKTLDKAKLPEVIKYGQEDAGFGGYNIIHRLQAVVNWLERSLPALDLDGVYGAKTKQKLAKMGLGNGAQLTAEQMAGILGITGY